MAGSPRSPARAALYGVLIGAVVTTTGATSLRWSGDGHRIVCQMAYERVTEATRTEIDRLIALDPEYETFADACVWADAVRAQIREGIPEVQRFAPYTPTHYVNTPRGSASVDPTTCTFFPEDGPALPCVVDGVREFTDSLLVSGDDAHRLVALKFVGHFVADVHQPLHSGYGDDRGGNDVSVNLMGQPDRNLHSVWDGFFIAHQGRAWPEYAAELGERIQPIDEALWKDLDPLGWANESFQIVEDAIYRDVDATGGYVGQLYFDRHVVTVERQLRKAAVRLALLLDSHLNREPS